MASDSAGEGGLVSPNKEGRYVAFGLKYPIHAPNPGRYASHASLRPDTMRIAGHADVPPSSFTLTANVGVV
jgi:hypothetical protein